MTRTAAAIAAGVRSGRLRARDVAEERLCDIAARAARFGAFTEVTAARARAEADAVDRAVREGRDPGPLAGVPVAAKNLFDLEGVVTLAGSRIERHSPPAREDAFLVRRLRAAGAVQCGALNMGEYAYDFTGENAHHGPSRNPRDTARMTGGSSGGSAAAVAAGLVPLALGSDTNGSIRVPASLCGVWGLKPTYGRLSRRGAFPFVNSFDHLGPFALCATDLALAYRALEGEDPDDPHQSIPPPCPDDGAAPRVAVLGGWFGRNVQAESAEAVRRVAAALGAAEMVELPLAEAARAAAFVVTMAEGANLHLPNLRARPDEFDPAVRDRLLAGALIPAHWVLQAQRVRGLWRREALRALREWDVLLAPATPGPAPLIGQAEMELDGARLPVRANLGLHTQPISCIGLPVVAAPVELRPLPVAVQLIAAPGREELLLRVARELEERGVCGAEAGA